MQPPLMGQAPAGYMPNPALMSQMSQLPQLNSALSAPTSQHVTTNSKYCLNSETHVYSALGIAS